MGICHWDDARTRERHIGHLHATWTFIGEAAGCVGVGVRRIAVEPDGWSTPAHEHWGEEEIFYVLSGHGLSWQGGEAFEIGAGDCIVYRAGEGAHSLHALEALTVLAFGPRRYDESIGFPRLGMSIVGGRAMESVDGVVEGAPIQFVREAALGAPELPPEPSPRPPTIVNVADVEPDAIERTRIARTRRDLGRAAGSEDTGLQHVEVAPGKLGTPQHCHSAEEEIFVVLEGEGVLLLDDEETPVGAGHVVSRPPRTRVAHAFRAGESGLTYLAYGTREPNDICWYPRSKKIYWRGVGVLARVEPLDYWDGED